MSLIFDPSAEEKNPCRIGVVGSRIKTILQHFYFFWFLNLKKKKNIFSFFSCVGDVINEDGKTDGNILLATSRDQVFFGNRWLMMDSSASL